MRTFGQTLIKYLAVCFVLTPFFGQAQISSDRVQAVLLGKILSYIKWPKQADVNDVSTPFVIGVLGNQQFRRVLDGVYGSGELKIKNKKVKIVQVNALEEVNLCNLLFIGGSEKGRLNQILKVVAGKPIISAGDTRNFAVKGVHINFYISRKRVRFEINEEAAVTGGFAVDYRLRKVAKVVGRKGGRR